MFGKGHVVQTVVGFLGFALAISSFWLGDYFKWDQSTEIFVAVSAALGTIIVEFILALTALRESIVHLYPSLDFSVAEQKRVYSLISNINELTRRQTSPMAKVALRTFDAAATAIDAAVHKSDFQVDNMFLANYLTLESVAPGKSFLAISAVTDPTHWRYDPHLKEYSLLNFRKVKEGINIKRVFVLKSEEQLQMMADVIREQVANGINVSYVYEQQISDINHFPDFSVVPESSFALYVPRSERLLTVLATHNEDVVARIVADFDKIVARATPLELT